MRMVTGGLLKPGRLALQVSARKSNRIYATVFKYHSYFSDPSGLLYRGYLSLSVAATDKSSGKSNDSNPPQLQL